MLHRYILKDFLMTFGMALAVMTMILYLGGIMKSLDYVARGVPGSVLVKIFTLNIPYILTFSIPISAMVATLLQFGRLSMDGEFTAMRAGGMSTWQIISPVVMAAVGLSFLCLIIQYEIAPESKFAQRVALVSVDELNPLDLLDEGRHVRFPGLTIWISRRDGNLIYDVDVYELDNEGNSVQTIRAKDGVIKEYPDQKFMRVTLNDVQVQHPDQNDPRDLTKAHIIDMDSYAFNLDYKKLLNNKKPTRNIGDMRISQLITVIRDVDKDFPNLPERRREETRMRALVDMQKRIGLSIACLSFVLIAIPLGYTDRRKESNTGIPIGLGLVVIFYVFITVADSLRKLPWLFPDLIIWIPIIGLQIMGALKIRKLP
jgi:lipopolysaccharide export LptBFGC system permease protein LptF